MLYILAKLTFALPLRLQVARRMAFAKAFNFIYFNKIEGVYMVFGVASGMTLKLALANARVRQLTEMSFYGVDTFEGFPETIGPENEFKSYPSIVGSRNFSKSTIQKVLGIGSISNVKLIKLNMEMDDLHEIQEIADTSIISIAHLDMDYYAPTLNALNAISSGLMVGSILLFDNFFFFAADDAMGERRALREFQQLNPDIKVSEYFNYGWHGKAFIVSATKA